MREVVHLALGSQACAVTAHWSNLQGLAATPSDGDAEAHCQATITHGVHQEVYVPRVLLVDTPTAFARTTPLDELSNLSVPTWSGSVERLEQESTIAPRSDALEGFLSTASTLAHSPYSRYRAPKQQKQANTAYQSHGRQVVWDDEEQEEEEEEEEVVEEQRRRQERQWQASYPSIQTSLDQYWNPPVAAETPKEEKIEKETVKPLIPWMDYFMPPYRPSSCLALPFGDTGAASDWDSYQAGLASSDSSLLQEWKEEELLESLRVILEDCDACQGFVVVSSGRGLTAGLTTMLLQQAAEDSPSSRRLVVSLQEKSDLTSSSNSWHETGIERVRSHVQTGMALQHFADSAHAVVPLEWPCGKNVDPFQGSATLAAHLETATLPYRLQGSDCSMIGLNAHYYGTYNGDFPFGTAPQLSFSEFIKNLVPSSSHSILELNGLLPGALDDLWSRLEQGTSLERDRRMRDPHRSDARRPQDVLPGLWMLDRDDEKPDDGILTSFSLGESQTTDRSSHRHYTVSAAIRRADASVAKGHYATALMEGMGIRFRPEQSVATVLDQSLGCLVQDGYSAGSYWKEVWKNSPVLSVLSNSSRIHPILQETARNMQEAFSPKCRGYLNRDVQSGLLPELEDCREALAGCLNLGDAYEPSSDLDQDNYVDDM